jgi:hypothetical protein
VCNCLLLIDLRGILSRIVLVVVACVACGCLSGLLTLLRALLSGVLASLQGWAKIYFNIFPARLEIIISIYILVSKQ